MDTSKMVSIIIRTWLQKEAEERQKASAVQAAARVLLELNA